MQMYLSGLFAKCQTAVMLLPLLFSVGKAGAADAGSIPYATEQVIAEGDSEAVIAEKAAKVLPRKNQTDWFRLEQAFFIHFGPNTFRHVEWGNGQEDPSIFNPTELNAEQWVKAVKDAGGKMIVPVCKHHDGFCMWPSRYEKHSVASSPWKNGKGDVIREVADAAKKTWIEDGGVFIASRPLPVEDQQKKSERLLWQWQPQTQIGDSHRSREF